MHVSMSEIIGNFILIAGSFLLLIFLVKKFAWNNINNILEARAKKITDDIDGAESARQKAEELANKREEELAGAAKKLRLSSKMQRKLQKRINLRSFQKPLKKQYV